MSATNSAESDHRRGLAAGSGPVAPIRPPMVFDLATTHADVTSNAGSRSSYIRAQNFCVGHSTIVAGDPLTETDVPDEHLVIVPGNDAVVRVEHRSGATADIDEPGLLIVPAGTSTITANRSCTIVRIFTARALEVIARARNQSSYRKIHPEVTPLPARPTALGPDSIRVHRLVDVVEQPGRLGRIFRSDSLMINWFPAQVGPRDPQQLSPHSHADFEQASVTLGGDYVHHFRTPWTPRLSEWRPDEHRPCASPSIAVIPAGIIHTTRAVRAGTHHLIDVFAPPRADFLERGSVLNAAAYRDRSGRQPAGRSAT